MFEFRPYQREIIAKATSKLSTLGIIMLAMQVRTGKTLTALGIAQKLGVKKVLFVTKKKVITSRTIHSDYQLLAPGFALEITHYQALHKADASGVDLFVVDESHALGAFPKPSLRAKRLQALVGSTPCVLLSGTPTPESWSQIYHQFWISRHSPFTEPNFYRWAKTYVDIRRRHVSHGSLVNDYTHANIALIQKALSRHILTYSQQEAGFKSQVKERIHFVQMRPSTYALVSTLERRRVFRGKKGGLILADTPVKLLQKVHQIYSGTIKLEGGASKILDPSKGRFIQEKFKGYKIAIFYKFKAELTLLQSVFKEALTTDIAEFNQSSKHIALQIVAGREGISLAKADYLVFYNIDFSATSYWQARDRLTTQERASNTVHWIFAKAGLEQQIYQSVQNKKTFTTRHYERIQAANKADTPA